MSVVDEKVEKRWKNYLWQSAAAGISIFVLTLFMPRINLVLVASAGATAFTVFAIPHHLTARTRNVIGGQTIGTLTGLSCSMLPYDPLKGGMAVGIGTLIMVSLNTEHPPAAGTALGLTIAPAPDRTAFILAAAVILALIRLSLSDYLRDLT